MLIQFSIKNYKSFKDKATMSFIASNYDKTTNENTNICNIEKFNLRILKNAVVYGANSSGKTKLFEAIIDMRDLIINSSKESQKGEQIDIDPFRLSTMTEDQPSEFEIVFYLNETLYRYGFEVDKNFVVSEWLYSRSNRKEIELFYRDYDEIEAHKKEFTKGKLLVTEKLVRENSLVLSVAAQFNDEVSGNIVDWFRDMGIISGIQEQGYKGFTMNQLSDSENKKKILKLLEVADISIKDIKVNKVDADNLPEDIPLELKKQIQERMKKENSLLISDIETLHSKYDENHDVVDDVYFSMDYDESHGTQKFFYLAGPILHVLENGLVLFIDEFDSRLHPNLVNKIISIFNCEKLNKNGAQLIINTHDTRILRDTSLRRDQVWFVEKNQYGESKIYSLSDFKSSDVRKNDNFEENYLKGKYGAVPYLDFFDELFYNL